MNQELIDLLHDLNPEALLLTGMNDCIIGICSRHSMEPVAAYSCKKLYEHYMADGNVV